MESLGVHKKKQRGKKGGKELFSLPPVFGICSRVQYLYSATLLCLYCVGMGVGFIVKTFVWSLSSHPLSSEASSRFFVVSKVYNLSKFVHELKLNALQE